MAYNDDETSTHAAPRHRRAPRIIAVRPIGAETVIHHRPTAPSPARRWRTFAAALMLSAAVLSTFSGSRSAIGANDATGAYLLSAQDRVRVTVYEWRQSRDEFFEWKAVNSEYSVQPNGTLSIPLIGEIRAAGLPTSEVAKQVAVALRERLGLAQLPDVALEVTQFRPVYVTGQVDKPGEFSYRPQLVVVQAVALSGGIRRAAAGTRVEREIITGRHELRQLIAEYSSLLGRRARFQAELARDDAIKFPPELTDRSDDPSVASLMEQERSLFEARRSALRNQNQTMQELRQFLESEVASLQQQIVTHNQQIDLVKAELESVRNLVTKGLAVEPRRLGLERSVAQLEGDRLRLESSLSRSRQEISKTGIALLELTTKAEIEAATGLRETQSKIEETLRKFDAGKSLLQEAETVAPTISDDPRGGRAQPVYTILRQRPDGSVMEIEAIDTTLVLPGDTIKVEMLVDDRASNRVFDIRRLAKQRS